ncbi:hypothetical protein KIN20_028716 [Parelaphostrongylus tenuis]|uniref:Uncharacterized protein n=1 Tax=Parelaphostrongylus tenuis TaxID=148309 RepID=A0AAD5R172_PARTN|nr:hypothetical protein KIN20_028716 [Parelaphostrongylus tenuis]
MRYTRDATWQPKTKISPTTRKVIEQCYLNYDQGRTFSRAVRVLKSSCFQGSENKFESEALKCRSCNETYSGHRSTKYCHRLKGNADVLKDD